MSMRGELLGAFVLLVIGVAAAFLVGRSRVGTLQWRRDGLVLAAIVGFAVIGAGALVAPDAVVLIGLPAFVAMLGAVALVQRKESAFEPDTRRVLLLVGAGAVVVGALGAVLGVIRLVAEP